MILVYKNDGFFEQDGQKYDMFNLPENFVIKDDVIIDDGELTELPDLSSVTVDGDFDCSLNLLKSLKGAPKKS